MTEQQFYVTVLWGENPQSVEQLPKTYRFETRAEAMAFVDGIELAQGWMNAGTIIHPKQQAFTPNDFDEDEESFDEEYKKLWKEYTQSGWKYIEEKQWII